MAVNQAFTYPGIPHGDGPLVVERIADPDQLDAMAPAIADLLVQAFSRQYEQPQGSITPGAFQEAYGNEARGHRVSANLRALTTLAVRGAYHVVRSAEDRSALAGLLRIQPAYLGSADPYIGDIMTNPGGSGIGSALLHAAIHDFDASSTAVLDAPAREGGDAWHVADWLESLDFDSTSLWIPLHIGEQTLRMRRYVLPPGIALRGLADALTERRPELANYERTTVEAA